MYFVQYCQALGVWKHDVFLHMVDHWILLGICRWSSFITRCSSTLLVCFSSVGMQMMALLLIICGFCLIQLSPCRLSIVFLAFDVFFVVFCVALACVIGIAVCCCLPCIIAILYAVADQVCQLCCRNIILRKRCSKICVCLF